MKRWLSLFHVVTSPCSASEIFTIAISRPKKRCFLGEEAVLFDSKSTASFIEKHRFSDAIPQTR